MKNLFFLSSTLFLLIISCGDAPTNTEVPSSTPVTETPIVTKEVKEVTSPIQDYSSLLGYYVGQFEAKNEVKKNGTFANKITISIDSIQGDSIFGHSIVAGNDRSFKGILEKDKMTASVHEPGDDKYDGRFNFMITENGKGLNGEWIANETKLKVTERVYDLSKRAFEYNKNLNLPEDLQWSELYSADDEYDAFEALTPDVITVNPSKTVLTKDKIENFYKGDLEVIRNSIYARHGYSFKNRKMRYIFDRIDWYMPIHTDIRKKLTAIEKKNIDLIKRYENHAETYYDSYGR